MRRTYAPVCVLLATLLTGCQIPPKEQDTTAKSAATQPSTEKPPPINLWERSRQCAEQAGRVITRKEAELRANRDVRLNKWENHYNTERERCYVRVSYLVVRPVPNSGLPSTFDELIDAFENRTIAEGVERGEAAVPTFFCSIKDGITDSAGDCAAARAYIDERMNK